LCRASFRGLLRRYFMKGFLFIYSINAAQSLV